MATVSFPCVWLLWPGHDTQPRGPGPLALLVELVGLPVGLRPRGGSRVSVQKKEFLCKGSEAEISNKPVRRRINLPIRHS